LKYAKYTFACTFNGEAILPPYKGSTLRGIFGHALKKVVCALQKQDCSECLLADHCLYTTVFEISAKAPTEQGRKRIAQPPHPYVIEPPTDLPFDVLTRAMLRRVSSLCQYHGEGEPELDYRGLVARAKEDEHFRCAGRAASGR